MNPWLWRAWLACAWLDDEPPPSIEIVVRNTSATPLRLRAALYRPGALVPFASTSWDAPADPTFAVAALPEVPGEGFRVVLSAHDLGGASLGSAVADWPGEAGLSDGAMVRVELLASPDGEGLRMSFEGLL
jgi:hypothetical protein